jgi:hypothetical protein
VSGPKRITMAELHKEAERSDSRFCYFPGYMLVRVGRCEAQFPDTPSFRRFVLAGLRALPKKRPRRGK